MFKRLYLYENGRKEIYVYQRINLLYMGIFMKEFYQMSSKEALEQMNSSMNGVSKEEASSLLEKHGENVLQEGERKSLLMVFLEQFKDLLVIILMIAATISMISGNVESTVVIIIVIILNALLGTVQFAKAQKSLDSLKALSSPNASLRFPQKN